MQSTRRTGVRGWCLRTVRCALVVALAGGELWAAPLAEHARDFRRQLIEQVMPYWHDRCIDQQYGGYVLADDGKGGGRATDKQLVSQARMIWGFAHAHRQGLGDGRRDYLLAAKKGHLFLRGHFHDRTNGGYFWKTDLAGKPVVDCKFLYGEAFVVYALVEYARASGEKEPLEQALELYRSIQKGMYDARNGGWTEHTERDWQPLKSGDPRNEVEVVGLKSANAHLHWMEALAELAEATGDPAVRASLAEALRINQEQFYPRDAGRSCFHRNPDWTEVTDPKSAGLSYGHNVEFAWLMVRAEQVLGRTPSWDHFTAHVEHALKHGYDTVRGGLYGRGTGNEPATDTTKVWWAQAEWVAALADAWRHRPEPRWEAALEQTVHFLLEHQVDKRDGIWWDTVAADGAVLRRDKAHNWKANYHDVRGLVKFIEVFGPAAPAR